MVDVVATSRLASRNALIEPTAEGKQAVVDQFAELQAAWEAGADAYRAAGPSDEQSALLEEADNAYDSYLAAVQEKLVPLALAGDYQRWFTVNKAEVADLAGQAETAVHTLADMERDEAAASAADAQAAYESQRTLSIVVLVVGIAVALGIGLVVARGIARGVGRVQKVAEALATGDLTQSSGLRTKDELGRMGTALDAAVASLRARARPVWPRRPTPSPPRRRS